MDPPGIQVEPTRRRPVATIVALDCLDGALLAGDRLVVEGGTVVGSRPHVFDFDDVAVAAVGDDPDGFRRQFDAALRAYATERGEPGTDAVARMTADVAGDTGVEALVVARDESGRANVRSATDGVLDERLVAFGSGASTVIGHLESVGEVDLDAAESGVREAFRSAAARDPGTGAEVDVSRLADEGSEGE